MNAELISVGTELLMGNIVNTNVAFLARECTAAGISVLHQVTVGDNMERLCDAIKTALERADIVILTGGLGPTKDDMTKEAAAKVAGRNIVRDAHSVERMLAYLKGSIYKEVPENNYRQADIIEGAQVLDNDNGIAPGIYVEDALGKKMFLLPGPPNELKPMFQAKVLPILMSFTDGILYSKMVKLGGISESVAETKILDLITAQTNPTIAPYAKNGQVWIRVTAKCSEEEEGRKILEPTICMLKERFGEAVFTLEEEVSLEEVLIGLLKERNMTVTTAESCTGGLLMGTLVNVSGASDVIHEAVVTYANEAKEKYLHVSHETLKRYGAVSEQTAYEMATGAAKLAGADAAVGITGIAGPGGGTKEKPVGTVYVGCYVNGVVTVEHYVFRGDRRKIREYSVNYAMDQLRRAILASH
ncbi:MAG: competence/damage-inducible protein A [Lachnospiraceae bacterium]|nr:competence/damage-inducible protein A [Lachnospiraceae bacterium]